MPQLDLSRYDGMKVSDVARDAARYTEQGKRALKKAKSIYEFCLSQNPRPHGRGLIRRNIWYIDKCLGRYPLFMSAAGQDRFIYQTYFPEKKDGIFVEIGAMNGWVGSNCYFFEKAHDWRGLIVEAAPEMVKQIASVRSNPIIHAAIADRDGTMDFIEITSGFTQMGGLADHYVADSLKAVRSDPRHKERTVQVRAMRLETLLREHDIHHVDYCSIDVEGAERAILADFDFSAFDITIMSAENPTGRPETSVNDIMRRAGYQMVNIIGADEIYCKSS